MAVPRQRRAIKGTRSERMTHTGRPLLPGARPAPEVQDTPDATPPGAEILRTRWWSRWKGTPHDLVRVADKAVALVRDRSAGAQPLLLANVDLGKGEEETYSSTEELERALRELGPARVDAVNIGVRDSAQAKLGLEINFKKSRPAAQLRVRGSDRVEVEGVNAELAKVIAAGRQWPPGPNTVFGFVIGGLLGLGLSTVMTNLNWSWLPDNIVGQVIAALVFFAAYGFLLLGFILGIPWFLPWFELVNPGQQTLLQQAKTKVIAGVGVAAGAIITAIVTNIFS